MLHRMARTLPVLALVSLTLLMTACSSPANRAAMTPQNLTVSKHHPYSLRVQTGGGSDTGALETTNISDADLKAAIEDAITQSQLFKTIVHGKDSDYELNVRVTSLSKPMVGINLSVELETAWSLVKSSDRSVVLRKSVKSTGSASMGDAFAFVTRLRLAIENASRDNITQGLNAIAEQGL